MRIQAGQQAKLFSLPDISGNLVNLEAYRGKRTMLSFYRYASCPFCNLRLRHLADQQAYFEQKRLNMIAVFQSPLEIVQAQMGKHQLWFPVIADAEHQLYRLYGLESSWFGYLRGAMQVKKYQEAVELGFSGGPSEGDRATIPADFLIDPDLTIAKAFYGRRIDEHLPLPEIESWLENGAAGRLQLGFES